MPDSQLSPAQLQQEVPTNGEFLMSGSLTAAPSAPVSPQDGGGTPMPGFHHRKEVQLILRKWRDSLSFRDRIRIQRVGSARDSVQRFVLPQYALYIK
ncbi:hypothetical protein [Arthrobacter sp. Br18]|uniref:hypothetical protein n=1 Tax=Arthrobacter sp. Br18 TaxID=1312954 RepID=UPI00047D186D|nr:hypothetical protein [Arthrobacter sp. Br18]